MLNHMAASVPRASPLRCRRFPAQAFAYAAMEEPIRVAHLGMHMAEA